MIVTFSCQNDVFVYHPPCNERPNPPYKLHPTIQDAIDYLKNKGKENIKIIEHDRYIGKPIQEGLN